MQPKRVCFAYRCHTSERPCARSPPRLRVGSREPEEAAAVAQYVCLEETFRPRRKVHAERQRQMVLSMTCRMLQSGVSCGA